MADSRSGWMLPPPVPLARALASSSCIVLLSSTCSHWRIHQLKVQVLRAAESVAVQLVLLSLAHTPNQNLSTGNMSE